MTVRRASMTAAVETWPGIASLIGIEVLELLERRMAGRPRLELSLPGPPIAKERARVFADKATGKVRAVTPKKTSSYEKHVANVARIECLRQGLPAGGFPPPARYLVFAMLMLRSDLQDASNVLKSIEDGLNGVAWPDDRYVCQPWPSKRVAGPHEEPGASVIIWAMVPPKASGK